MLRGGKGHYSVSNQVLEGANRVWLQQCKQQQMRQVADTNWRPTVILCSPAFQGILAITPASQIYTV